MILIPEVLTIEILNALFAIFATISFIKALEIYKKWNINSSSQLQYSLEKKSYLSATIIKYIFLIKIPLMLFFIFTLDKISNVLAGAMCGAGVIDASNYGLYLFIFKIINLYLFAYWIALHSEDLRHEDLPYTQLKFGFFILIYFMLMSEIILETLMFSSIDLNEIVNCCGTIYSNSQGSYISLLLSQSSTVLFLFYFSFSLIVLSYILKKNFLFGILNIIFLIISLSSLIAYFGTYIYELPSHHCPFCFLQAEYNYIGYLLYILLFLGTFFGLLAGFLKTDEKNRRKNYTFSIIFSTLYLLVVSYYPLIYFIKNGVWLQ